MFLHDRNLSSPRIEQLLSTMKHDRDIDKMHVLTVRQALDEYEVRAGVRVVCAPTLFYFEALNETVSLLFASRWRFVGASARKRS